MHDETNLFLLHPSTCTGVPWKEALCLAGFNDFQNHNAEKCASQLIFKMPPAAAPPPAATRLQPAASCAACLDLYLHHHVLFLVEMFTYMSTTGSLAAQHHYESWPLVKPRALLHPSSNLVNAPGKFYISKNQTIQQAKKNCCTSQMQVSITIT